jgi:hypothetical protein
MENNIIKEQDLREERYAHRNMDVKVVYNNGGSQH